MVVLETIVVVLAIVGVIWLFVWKLWIVQVISAAKADRTGWVVAIVLLGWLGGLAYMLVERPASGAVSSRPTRSHGPAEEAG